MIAIRNFREQMRWTQAYLAERCGVAKSTVSMWETGERKPDIIMLKKLAGIFGCSADDLLEPIIMKKEETA